MTCSTTKKLTEPLDEPEKEFCRLRRASWRQQHNEFLAIAERNLFDDEASSSNNTGAKRLVPSKTLGEHSLPSSASFQNPITLLADQTGRIIFYDNISQKDKGKLDQFAHFRFSSLTKEEGAHEADECDQNNPTEQVCLSGEISMMIPPS
nr:hypothetical protein [Tanacetum cinerariifolium]